MAVMGNRANLCAYKYKLPSWPHSTLSVVLAESRQPRDFARIQSIPILGDDERWTGQEFSMLSSGVTFVHRSSSPLTLTHVSSQDTATRQGYINLT